VEYGRPLENEDLDVLSLATPSTFHYDPVIKGPESDADPDIICCGKLLVNSLQQAYEMAQRDETNDTELVVDHTLRFSEAFRTLRDLLQENRLFGEIRSVHIHPAGC
jgi:predicted dehydrogenase